jgi:drug/metabolite transporter (DMT)-like permease
MIRLAGVLHGLCKRGFKLHYRVRRRSCILEESAFGILIYPNKLLSLLGLREQLRQSICAVSSHIQLSCVSSRVFGNGDARPVTLYMSATATVLLLLLCAASGDFAFPQSGTGWIGFGAAAVFYGFAIIIFLIAISMIGPVRAPLFSYSDAVISAILGVVVLGQTLTAIQVAGITLVIIALVSTTVRRDQAT